MVLKIGSKGKEVKSLQEYLGLYSDGDFGPNTEKSVKEWQLKNGLSADGIVGPKTWDSMGLATTDNSESMYVTSNGLNIERYYLPKGEYNSGPTKKEELCWSVSNRRATKGRSVLMWISHRFDKLFWLLRCCIMI